LEFKLAPELSQLQAVATESAAASATNTPATTPATTPAISPTITSAATGVATTNLPDSTASDEQVNEPALGTLSATLNDFVSTGLTGQDLTTAKAQFNNQTGEPVVALQFNDEARDRLAEVTKNNQGRVLAIFIDGTPVTMPVIQDAIIDGRASISGNFTAQSARNLAIQLKAGALPVPIEIMEQRAIGASLGEQSVQISIKAGFIGLGLVMLFMILYYRAQGVIASLVLMIYAVLTIAIYKLVGVTLTLPGIAGLLLSVGMAVDSNILIFERMKTELRVGHPFKQAMERGFGKAWDSIKDANLATIMTALVLINPLDFPFLNTSGLVRGFGITLLIGVLISLFTGVVVSRNLLRVFLPIFQRLHHSRADHL
jgi:preprotein translocase subunit SecD